MSPAEMDSDKVELEAADAEEYTASGEPKACTDCYTTKTPLWRGGPTGPKSLCNACGIRYRKRRRVAMGLDPEAKRKPKRDEAAATAAAAAEAAQENEEDGDGKPSAAETKTQTVELHMVGFAKDAVLKQRRRMRRKPSCLGEEERAAILLMALSSGVIYA
ncbi:GATA transcription factor 16-like [Lolium rigidum]|uniref:GATA transcription factor 16-like n=1 Tax=Lolium rigidum TaxID=89674 RepID=UPI001F5DBD6F|nr:GATA transcription factor 16-like [Lolium rigidum]